MIGSFFFISLLVFHNYNKSKLITLIKFMFNCSTYYHGLLASQLTAALPFSMRTSSWIFFIYVEDLLSFFEIQFIEI